MSLLYRTFRRGGSSGFAGFAAFLPASGGAASCACFDGLPFFALSSFLLTLLSWGQTPRPVLQGTRGLSPCPSLDNVPALLACPRTASITQNLIGQPRVLFAVLANDGDIRDMDWRFLLHNAAFDVALRVRARVTLDHLNAFDHDILVLRQNDEHAACLAAVLSAQDENFVILFDWRHRRHFKSPPEPVKRSS